MPPEPYVHPTPEERPRRRRPAVLAGAGVLAAGALAVAAGQLAQQSDPPQARATTPLAAAPASKGEEPADGDAAGWKRVEHAGISIAVPGDWPVHDLEVDPETCVRSDRHAVYLAPAESRADDVVPDCPAHLVGKTETVYLEVRDEESFGSGNVPTSSTVVDGHDAVIDNLARENGQFEVLVPDLDVLVRVTHPEDDTLARRILASVEEVAQ